MKIKNLNDLFLNELRDIYHAEKQLLKALPKMAKAASSDELRNAFDGHLQETRQHVQRLEQVFQEFDEKAKGKTCEAMEGLVAEGSEVMDKASEPAALDAGLIASAQKVEHYEIASYGTLVSWANRLGRARAADLLKQTLAEEKAADEKLTSIAERRSNPEADGGQARTGGAGDDESGQEQGGEGEDMEDEESPVGARQDGR